MFPPPPKDVLLSSPDQVSKVLFDDLKLPRIQKTGRPNKTSVSTGEDVLLKLSVFHQFPKLVLEHRSHTKLLNTCNLLRINNNSEMHLSLIQ
mmetsp:Transcript_30101/g.41962  ORF Transcript_30101/g.41962 Transcript_30101/m.41962 type:complete len:92 (-) Transcript_30101:1258-1533(-)